MVIVTTRTSPGAGSGDDGYRATADRMMELATSRDGFLDVDTVRGADRRADAEHVESQRLGVAEWYSAYTIDAGWMVRTAERPPAGC